MLYATDDPEPQIPARARWCAPYTARHARTRSKGSSVCRVSTSQSTTSRRATVPPPRARTRTCSCWSRYAEATGEAKSTTHLSCFLALPFPRPAHGFPVQQGHILRMGYSSRNLSFGICRRSSTVSSSPRRTVPPFPSLASLRRPRARPTGMPRSSSLSAP